MTTTNDRRVNSTRLLAFVGVMLVVNTCVQLAGITPASASASAEGRGPNDPPAFPNNAEVQRRQADALTEINAKLARIEAKLEKGLSVKVTEMPPITLPTTADAAAGK